MKKILILFSLTFVCSNVSFSQCNDSIISSTSCFLTGNNYNFYSSQGDVAQWQIYDSTGTQLSNNGSASNINYLFTSSGNYHIRFNNYNDGCEYHLYIYVTDIPISLICNTSTLICIGGSIDYNSLAINISNAIGSITYDWVTSPSGLSWSGLIPYPIPAGESNFNLIITDNTTGCSDSQNININYQSTSANASFNMSNFSILCPGQTEVFTANNINLTLYGYSWEIDGVSQNSGFNGVLNGNIYPIDTNVTVTLYVEDLANGCIVSNSQFLIANNPLYAAFDTTVNNYDHELNSFVYCENDSTVIDTLYNYFNNLNDVDSVVIDLGLGGAQTYTPSQGFDQFYLNLSESINTVTLTTYFSDSCLPVILTYNFIYNKQLSSVNVNFGTCTNTNLCIGDTVKYFIDPQQFQMPLNAEILWVISCDSSNVDTIIWNYNDVLANTYLTDADCNPNTPKELYIVFKHVYGTSSCGCYFYDNTIGDIYDQFRIIPIFVTACQSNAMTLGLTVYVPPIPTANFTIVDSVCYPATVSMFNDSEFGCQNSLNPNYNPSSALYSVLNPTFNYNFGNCIDSIYVPTVNQYNTNSFQTISNTYTKPGIYQLELEAINSCTSIKFNDSITIFPKPNVSFTADTVCQGLPTSFLSLTSIQSTTTDTITCSPNDIIFSVPEGFPISNYSWSMDNNIGTYVNGTSNSSANPQFIFQNCGEYLIGLTVSDSLGCDSTFYSNIIVYELPSPNFSFNNFECVGIPTCINDLSQNNTNNNCYSYPLSSWEWNIEDENGLLVYTNSDNSSINFCENLMPPCDSNSVSFDYSISLILSNSFGCRDTTTKINTIFCNPVANFNNSGICFDSINGGEKLFINTSTPQNGVNWKWYFGDGDSSTLVNPIHNYLNPGTYDVTLILIGNNCNDTITKSIEVWENISTNSNISNILCFSENTGSLEISTTGGTPTYNYNWSGPSSFVSNNEDIYNLYSGTYILNIMDINGCSFDDTLIILENNLITGFSSVNSCNNYQWNNQNITQSGNYTQSFTSFNGCDSVHTLNVNINYSNIDTSYINACNTFLWNNILYDTSGTYFWSGTDQNGCDSTEILSLTINSTFFTSSSILVCDSYTWNSTYIDSSGSYTQIFTNIIGCDSVHTLNVIINYSNVGVSNIDTCDTFIWNNQNITQSGTYTQTLTNISGCDSVHTLNAIIRYSSNEIIDITACDNYTWEGVNYSLSGIYSNVYMGNNGCDSAVTLNLTINYSEVSSSLIDTCNSYQWNNIYIDSSGSYTQTFTNIFGCDSVHTLNVNINYSNSGNSNIDTCDTFIWNNQNITQSGTYTQTLTNISGCDSIHTLNAIIRYSSNEISTIEKCDFYDWNSQLIINSGVYTQIFTNTNGCDSLHTLNVIIKKSSISIINILDSLSNCAPLFIDSSLFIANDSINSINNFYQWTITHQNGNIVQGNGVNPPLDSIINDNDSVNVQLIVTNNYGCNPDTSEILVRTIESPIAIFSLDTLSGCNPLNVFTDTTGLTQNANYTWDVLNQNGVIINSFNGYQDSFILTNNSNSVDSLFTIQITVGDINTGCVSNFSSNSIKVLPQPIADFFSDNVCDSSEVMFINNSNPANSPIISWQWNYGDTLNVNDTSSISNPLPYIFSSWGNWNISLVITDQNFCKDTINKIISIYPNPEVNFTSLSICDSNLLCNNQINLFNDNSFLESFGGLMTNEYWYIDNNFSDSSIFTQTFSALLDSGIHTIKHIVKTQYGCRDSISKNFEVVNIPIPKFEINDTICGNDTSLISITNLSYGTIERSYIKVTDINDSIVLIDSIYNDTAQIFIQLNSATSIIKYYVELIVSNCCGDSTFLDSIIILPNPNVFFVTNPICGITPIPVNSPLQLYFTNFVDTLNTDSVIIRWGDGNNSNMIYPDLNGGMPVWPDLSHSYQLANSYNICITGYNECDSTTYCCLVDVIPNQINSGFQVLQNYSCEDDSCGIQLRELSSQGFSNAIVNWWFDYDPNSIPNYPNFNSPDLSIPYQQFDTICWKYTNPGTYLILHEIIAGPIGGPTGPTFIDTSVNWLDTIIVYPKPNSNFICQNVCLFDTVTFFNNSSINNSLENMPNQSIVSWQWYVDENPIASSWDLRYSFTSPGEYWIKLETTSNFGCISIDSCQISVFDLPIANFIFDPVCDNTKMAFIDSSIESNHPISNWTWTISNGVFINSSNNSQNPLFLFDNCSNINSVVLKVEDNFGCIGFDTTNVTVYCNPIANFSTGNILCHNSSTFFYSQSNGFSAPIISWNWDFGQYANPQFSSEIDDSTSYYLQNGNHNIQLTVVDSNNCSNIKDSIIFINDNPTASFDWINVCSGEPVIFNNTSSFGLNPITTNNWEFSDGGISSLFNPNYNFTVNDTVGSKSWAILKTIDIKGCIDTFDSREVNKDIEIHPLPVLSFISNPICDEGEFIFINNSYMSTAANQLFNDSLYFPNPIWSFDNGNVNSNDSIWYFTPNSLNYGEGIYNLSHFMGSSFISEYSNSHCIADFNKNVEILVTPKINPDTLWTNNQCGEDVEFSFSANPSNVNTYSYFIDDIYNSNLPITTSHEFIYKFNSAGIYSFSQYIYNQNGCYDSITNYLHVYPKPSANFNLNIDSGCEELNINFLDSSYIEFDSLYDNGSSEIIIWNWNFDNGQFSNNTSPNSSFNTINGDITYYSPSLYVETNYGCSNLIQKNNKINIHPSPVAIITTPIIELGPGLYNFDGSQSNTSNNFPASTNLFNYIWTTNNDTLWDQINQETIDYQYPPNNNYQNSNNLSLYDICLILEDKTLPFQCSDTTCINPGLFVNYFKSLNVPNALAPNDISGETSYFLPKGQSLEEYHLQIFDTWGNLIWQTREITNFDKKPAIPWRGTTVDNTPLPQGTYVWKIYAKFTDGSNWQGIDGKTTGSVYLIR